jgi:hypothetical protein
MAKKIISKDIIDEDIFSGITNDAEKLLTVVKDITAQTKKFAKTLSVELKDNKIASADDVKKLEATQKAIEKTTASLDKLNKVEKEAQKQRLAEIKLQQDREKAFDKFDKTLQKQAELKRKASSDGIKSAAVEDSLSKLRIQKLKAIAILESNAIGTEQKLLAQNTLLRIERAKLVETDKNYEADLKRINSQLDKNNEKIKNNSDALKKQKMNVGNYTTSIKDALANTGLFNNGIGNLITSLNALRKSQEAATTSSGKLSNVLKGGVVGAVLIAVAALKSLYDVSQNAQDALALTAAKAKDLVFATTAFSDSEKAIQSFRIELRKLKLELQAVALNEQDFNEIAADQTIGYNERNKALQEAVTLSKERAKIETSIAQKELDNINKEVKAANVQGSALNELLDRQTEAQLKLNEAVDAEDDLTRQNDARIRAQFQTRLVEDIELIRSKKLSASSQIQILTAQIADEKNQLEDRAKSVKELRKAEKAETDEEFRLFQTGVEQRIDFQNLVATKDAVILSKKIKSLNLATALETELAKIVKQAQDNEIANGERVNALKDEQIKRLQKLAETQREISRLQREDAINDTELIINSREQAYNDATQKILDGEVLFTNELRQIRENELEFEKANIEQIYNLKRENLEENAKSERIAAENNIPDLKLRAAEIEKINAKLKIDLDNLTIDQQRKAIDVNKKAAEDLKKIKEKERKEILSIVSDTTDQITNEINKRKQAQIDAQDEEIEKRKTNIERQEALAAQGLDNTLEFEKKKQAEAELEKKRLQKEQEKREKRQIFFKSVIAGLEGAKSTQEALQSVARATAITALSETVAGFFKDGVEGFKGKGTGTSDSNIVAISNGESVVTAKGTKNYEGLATAMNNGDVEKWIGKNYSAGQTAEAYNPQVLLALRSVEKAIKEKESISINWDGHDTRVETLVRMGHKKTIKHINGRNRL